VLGVRLPLSGLRGGRLVEKLALRVALAVVAMRTAMCWCRFVTWCAAMELEIIIDADGHIGAIYSDALLPYLAAIGDQVETRRASDVEPDGTGWSAWIRPETWWSRILVAVGAWLCRVGACKLGPYPSRGEALAAEVAYLQQPSGYPARDWQEKNRALVARK